MQPWKQFLIAFSGFSLIMGIIYAATLDVNDTYGWTWVNSTNIDVTNYYLGGVGINARLGGDYSGLALTGTTLDTGQGPEELYAMNQDVQTTDDVTFDNITATDEITLGGVARNTWPAGGGTGEVQFEDYLIFGNVTAYYSQNPDGVV